MELFINKILFLVQNDFIFKKSTSKKRKKKHIKRTTPAEYFLYYLFKKRSDSVHTDADRNGQLMIWLD